MIAPLAGMWYLRACHSVWAMCTVLLLNFELSCSGTFTGDGIGTFLACAVMYARIASSGSGRHLKLSVVCKEILVEVKGVVLIRLSGV